MRGLLRVQQVTQPTPRHTCALVLSLPDYDVFSGSALSNSLVKILADLRSRADPSFHDVKPARPLSLAGIRLLSSIASWWSQTGSNRRPHACKARALPTELWPQSLETRQVSCRSIRAPVMIGAEPRRRKAQRLVGPGRLELPTSRLSGVRSNQLSYGPRGDRSTAAGSGARWARDRTRTPERRWARRKEKRRRRRPAPRY